MSAGPVPEYFAASALRMEAVGDAMVKNLKILTVLKLIMSNPQQQQPLHHRVDLLALMRVCETQDLTSLQELQQMMSIQNRNKSGA